MICLYGEYAIEPFEAGRGLWHARIRRADRAALVINDHAFASLEVGFAWPDPDAAINDAKRHIDRFKSRWTTSQAVGSAA
jgi:hypothetical protein